MAAIGAFSIWGIRVRIDQSWFIAFLLFAWTLSMGYFPMQVPDYPAFTYWLFGTLSSLALFASVLIHELSHCVVARRLGIGVKQITLFIFGGVSEMDQTHSSSPKAEFKITIAGPLSSFALGVLFLAIGTLMQDSASRIAVAMFHYLYYVNFLLGAFNLIPGFPLDGGRILRSYLWYQSGNLRQATRSASRIGEVFAYSFIVIGLFGLFMMHVIPGIWLILIGMFLRKSAESEYRSFEVRVGLQNMKLSDIMSPPVAVNTSMSITEFINDYAFHYHYRVYPVLEDNRFVGMIDVRAIKNVPLSEWPTTRIGKFLSDPSIFPVLHPDTDATDALRALLKSDQNQAPVVQNGLLLGLITREDLLKVVSLKNDLAA